MSENCYKQGQTHAPTVLSWATRGEFSSPRLFHASPIMSTANPMEATNPALEEDPEAILQEISDLLSALRNNEKRWRDRCEMLEKEGYTLRPRLRPGWTPSWLQSGKNPTKCEDGEPLPVEISPDHRNHRVNGSIDTVQACGCYPQRKR